MYEGCLSILAFKENPNRNRLDSYEEKGEENQIYKNYRDSIVSIDQNLIDQLKRSSNMGGQHEVNTSNMVPRGSVLAAHIKLNHGYLFKDSLFTFFKNIRKRMDFSFLKRPTFILLCLSKFFGDIAFFIPWSFIPSIMETKHIDSDNSSILLSFLGIASMISRLLNGALLDRKEVSPLIVCTVSTCVAGLALFMLPFCDNFEMFAIVGSIYGLFSGGYIVSQTIVLVAIYGIESMVTALGMFS